MNVPNSTVDLIMERSNLSLVSGMVWVSLAGMSVGGRTFLCIMFIRRNVLMHRREWMKLTNELRCKARICILIH